MADAGALRSRLMIGPVLIAALAGLFWLDARAGDAAPCLLVLALALTVRGSWEFVDLLRAKGFTGSLLLVGGCSAAVLVSNWAWLLRGAADAKLEPSSRLGIPLLVFALSVMVLFGNALRRYRQPGGNLETLGLELLGLSYLGVFISLTAQLRWVASPALCYLPLASVVVVTKCGDTAAFFTGRAMGGAKLSPLISPGKTRWGAAGALVGAALGGWLTLSVAPAWLEGGTGASWYWSIPYGVMIGGLGIVGDLAESLIKRDVGRKDSAPLLPGFGGLLDLLDSVIFTGPAAYLLWLILPLPR